MVHCAEWDITICIQNKWVEVEVEFATVICILVDLLHFPAQGLLLPRVLGLHHLSWRIEMSAAREEPLFPRL